METNRKHLNYNEMRMVIGILISSICILLTIIFDSNKIDLAYFIFGVIVFPIFAIIGAYLQGYYKGKEESEKNETYKNLEKKNNKI